MNKQKKPYFSSALWPGIVLGILSVIPIVNYVNLICCLWVIAGGVLSSLIFKQEFGDITPGQGAITGLIAGIVGAFVQAIGVGVLWYFFHENYLSNLYEIVSSAEFDIATQEMMAEVITNQWLMIAGSLIGGIMIYSVFALFGGLIGAAIFRKKKSSLSSESETKESEIEE
ncbi:hypothetical protein KAH81_07895 [bacterium]|nr:hypothetical protein [bacterium]